MLPAGGQIVVLLALTTGLPQLADAILPVIEAATQKPLPLDSVLPIEPDPAWADQLAALHAWLDDEPEAKKVDVAGLSGWVDLLRRFRFRR